MPFSVKDLVTTKGVRTTFGTPLYRDNVPAEDAPSVERLKAAGAIMLGKTNTPTFGWVGVTDNLLFGATRNPWNLERHAGRLQRRGVRRPWRPGSARSPRHRRRRLDPQAGRLRAGSSGTSLVRAGSRSIRPARRGASRTPGPMTRTVKDAALMMNVCAGPDERDQYSLPAGPSDYVKALRGSLKGLRVAWSEKLGSRPRSTPR